MKVKTFHALTMQDAIRAIKDELGPDAIILSSREVQQGGRLLRLFNRPVLEVMAAAEEAHQETIQWTTPTSPERTGAAAESAQPMGQGAVKPPYEFQETLRSLLKPSGGAPMPSSSVKTAPVSRPSGTGWKKERLRRLRGELHELSRLLGASLPPETQSLDGHLSAELTTCCRSLIGQGLRPSTTESLGHEVRHLLGTDQPQSHDRIHDAMQKLLADRIRVSGPLLAGQGDRTISLMLGPSGSGKTTVITKLAAHYRLEEKKSVAIITFDTYRRASVEQLRMYAGVLGVPFASARSARQVHEGLRRHAHADVVLLDMPGVGPDDVASAKELHQLLTDEAAMDIHLVVPASMREQDLLRLYDRVKDLPLLRLLFTKLDETSSFGTVFELAHQTGAPLSYWSAGQRVPEDLEIATPERLAAFLMAQRYVAPRMPDQPPVVSSSHDMPEPVGASTGQNER